LAEQVADLLNASGVSFYMKLKVMQVASALLSEESEAATASAAEQEELRMPASDSPQSPED